MELGELGEASHSGQHCSPLATENPPHTRKPHTATSAGTPQGQKLVPNMGTVEQGQRMPRLVGSWSTGRDHGHGLCPAWREHRGSPALPASTGLTYTRLSPEMDQSEISAGGNCHNLLASKSTHGQAAAGITVS